METTRPRSIAIRCVEVGLLRAIANQQIPSIVEAENLHPGNGVMYLFHTDGTKLKLEITECVVLATDNKTKAGKVKS